MPCPFCDRISSGPLDAENELAVAFADAFPLSPGHMLIIPRRHVEDYFALDEAEQAAIWQLVSQVRTRLDAERHPDGYNLGVNVGEAAGQTVAHAHVHLIPRYEGDVPDPRGGIRWLLAEKAKYWEQG